MSDTSQVDLVVTGMTCASCASRIERKLNKIEGVEASVNYATGVAHVNFTPKIEIDTLVSAVTAAGYNALPPNPLLDEQVAAWEAAHEKDLKLRWQFGALFAIPTVAIAMIESLHFAYWAWVTIALATPVVVWAAWPLHRAFFRNARHRATTMDTLVSIGIIAAYVGSIWQLVQAQGHHEPHIYIDVAVVVPVFVLIGRWLEARNKRAAGASLRALADATPKSALQLVGGVRVQTAVTDLRAGDIVVVPTESTIPVDGIVTDGVSSVSNALLTGESMPSSVSAGSEIQAGAITHEGELQVQVVAVGAGSQVARIASLVAAAQSGKANIARLADRVSAIFVPVVLAITVITGLVWYLAIDADRAVDVMIAVLVIACPCALGLATPTALVVGSGRAASLGILIAGPEVFENSRKVDVVIFDKTGTLTTGLMSVTGMDLRDEHRGLMAALADASSHPVSAATSAALADSARAEVLNVIAAPGKGVRGSWNGQVVEFGGRAFHPELDYSDAGVGTRSYLFIDGEVVGSVDVADSVDQSSAATVSTLKSRGIRTVMASGDRASVAEAVGAELGIDEVRAELTPDQKIEIVREFQSQGRIVAMVGDGSNDAPALAQADIGIAMGRGTAVARATADITLLRPDLSLVPTALALSQRTLRVIKQNLAWAFGYNIAAIPLAISGNLNPMIAGIAMSASSVLVVSNSLRLR